MANRQRKSWIWGGIALTVIILLTIFAAPSSNKIMAGSTYSKEPSGYGAWYQYMLDRDFAIERWQKPFSQIIDNKKDFTDKPITYLQVYPSAISLNNLPSSYTQWLRKGNQLIVLNAEGKATKASFVSTQSYNDLQVQIKTTRRKQEVKNPIIKDEQGAIVWKRKIGTGEIIYAVSPYIAANAYQEVADNYQFLASLINSNHKLFIDEYIHGYKDVETKKVENKETLEDYLAKTIWLPIGIQGLVIAIISLLFLWQRFGQIEKIEVSKTDNSQAYIEALARVLEKAESTNFVAQTIGKDEQIKLQQKLGLGKRLLAADIVINEWNKQTNTPSNQLQSLLKMMKQTEHITESDLVKWMQKWQQINQEK